MIILLSDLFRPYHSHCNYCHIKYDVIGHLEDSSDDTAYLAIKQNLTALLPELMKTKNHHNLTLNFLAMILDTQYDTRLKHENITGS